MFRIHFRTCDRFEHYIRGLGSTVCAFGSSDQPVIVIGGHQDEFPSTMPGDFHRLTSSLMLKITESSLEFQGGRLSHDRSK